MLNRSPADASRVLGASARRRRASRVLRPHGALRNRRHVYITNPRCWFSDRVWASASSVTTVPTGTTLALSVRFGDTPTPDGTWSSFSSVALGNAALAGTSRYAQYRDGHDRHRRRDSRTRFHHPVRDGSGASANGVGHRGKRRRGQFRLSLRGVHGLALRPHVQPGERVLFDLGRHRTGGQRLSGCLRHSSSRRRIDHGQLSWCRSLATRSSKPTRHSHSR